MYNACEYCNLHNNPECLICPIEEQEQSQFIELAGYIKGKERANDSQSISTFNPSINLQNKIIH